MKLKLGPHPSPDEVSAPLLDWSTTGLGDEYEGCYAKIIDNVFTPEECAALVALAESGSKWEKAAVHYGMGPGESYVDTSYRNSERILRFDKDAAEKIYQRLLPYVPEIVEIKPGGRWQGIIKDRWFGIEGSWKLVGLNERLSFMRYGPGHFFKEHCDTHAHLPSPDGRKSWVTVQIYLEDEGVEGGATRFHAEDNGRFFDVAPKKGRVLIFQQEKLLHSGANVVKGLKYNVPSSNLGRTTLLFTTKPRKRHW